MTGEEEQRVITEFTDAARKRVEQMGGRAAAVVHELRAELEATPRLGRMVGVVKGGTEIWVTRTEPRESLPGLTVTYVYTPEPPPPTAVIVSAVPDDGDDARV
ncbi:hypothetical protein [Streptomyces sp. SLBN-118]|uniref:hypothetical protein n=1 Tax=Streptomyces sp. SLBN-118 TaxID=2768454 RepID=UPI00114DEB16|nr:hypothetical protein [Streptomyces sp. SLBN-118]